MLVPKSEFDIQFSVSLAVIHKQFTFEAESIRCVPELPQFTVILLASPISFFSDQALHVCLCGRSVHETGACISNGASPDDTSLHFTDDIINFAHLMQNMNWSGGGGGFSQTTKSTLYFRFSSQMTNDKPAEFIFSQ
jgi:hypothetical protein